MSSEHLAPAHWQPETSTADEQFKQASLALLAGQLASYTPEGYPGPEGRLKHIGPHPLTDRNADISWKVGQQIPALEEEDAIEALGMPTGSYGRPLHPWLPDMLSRPDIGVVTGKGILWRWGPNYTADAIVRQAGQILLIERDDCGMPALPGGFVDYDEKDVPEVEVITSTRELGEEAILEIAPELGREIFRGVVADPRMTAHAWPETTAFLFDLGDDPNLPAIGAGDETKKAFWVPEEKALALAQTLYGSHGLILQRALRA